MGKLLWSGLLLAITCSHANAEYLDFNKFTCLEFMSGIENMKKVEQTSPEDMNKILLAGGKSIGATGYALGYIQGHRDRKNQSTVLMPMIEENSIARAMTARCQKYPNSLFIDQVRQELSGRVDE